MECTRCEDIHSAQSCGFTVKECECSCHNDSVMKGCITFDTPPYEITSTAPTLDYKIGTSITTCNHTGCSTLNLN